MAVCEKRSLEETVYNAKNVLLDIEGTTTSISFVKDTLFPYVRKSLESYISANWDKDEFKEVLTLLQEQAKTDVESKVEGVVAIPKEGSADEQQAAVVSNVLWQMDNDRKTTALKQLQGLVWRLGYKDGELKGHVYPDVAPALRRWTENGRKLYVYSSGSVEAQKLLFKYSQEGDLSELFSGHFDTTVGPKVEADSYKAILKSIDSKPDNVIFLTDVPKEASAAREAGLPVVLVTRDDAQELSADEKGDFTSVSTLEDVVFSASATKKQKVDTEANGDSGKAAEEKMDVEETPKTEVADKEEPKTEVADKVEEKTVSEEKVTETKEETVEKMEEDSETKEVEKPEVVEEKKVEEAKPVEEKKEEEVKPVEDKEEVKPVEEKKEEEVKPVEEKKEEVKPTEEKKEEEVKPVEEKEEVKPVEETAKPSEETEKVVEAKKTEEEVKKSEEAKTEEAKPVETEEKVEETKTEEVKKVEEPKAEKTSEEKKEEKTVDKAEEAVEEKAEEVEKGVEAKEETEKESEAPKQNGVENGAAVNGVSNGKTENGVNGKEAEKVVEEVVVKKAAPAAPAEAEVAAEA